GDVVAARVLQLDGPQIAGAAGHVQLGITSRPLDDYCLPRRDVAVERAVALDVNHSRPCRGGGAQVERRVNQRRRERHRTTVQRESAAALNGQVVTGGAHAAAVDRQRGAGDGEGRLADQRAAVHDRRKLVADRERAGGDAQRAALDIEGAVPATEG